ncbi:synapse-associated protein of 47 kDa [Coccinella septempunctata]|uniref:synapse-associated protein of 47 kDa n=1 Tax=Coccinella septempunctata TaxID=41139 RepID=UPI001D06EEEA|nr:synapse-associated protein of 47 kDa [Coccinella septempunctata]
MFHGITNQVSSWMGAARGDNEEKVPTPTEDNNAIADYEKKDMSPTKQTGSKLDMLTNVKGQIQGIGGWIGSSIPKLRKGEEQTPQEIPEEQVEQNNMVSTEQTVKPPKDDDDNSSATGGADSGPGSNAETPTDEKEGQFGNVQSKALAGAKSFGSFLYSAVNKAGKTVTESAAKIKETVEKNSILGEFNKEQEAFMKSQVGNSATALPPWAGCQNEEALKEECLSLSTDRRSFIRSPPAGVDFQFDYEVSYPIAMAIMEQDPNLEQMRYELVPKVISEENFWRNYFYRVSLICQANEMSFISKDGESKYVTETSSDPNLVNSANERHEFVSDTLRTDQEVLAEVEEGMKKLNMGTKPKEEDWEKELEAELQDYEVVSENNKLTFSKNDNWEQEVDELLQDGIDLK